MLTPEDAAAVPRRAAELDTPTLEQHDTLDEHVVRAAAADVGLSESAVDRAVQEWRAGALAPLPPLERRRRGGLDTTVAVETRVALRPALAGERVEEWLRGQWFERRVLRGSETDWAPRRSVLAAARRAADLDGRLRLTTVHRLRVCVAPAQEGARIRVVADVRDSGLAAAVAVPAAVVGVVGVGAGLAGAHEALLALPAAAGLGGAGWLSARAVLDRRRAHVAEELERALGELERPVVRRALPDRAAAYARQLRRSWG